MQVNITNFFLDNEYIVYLCPLPRLDVQWSFKWHKLTKYQQLQNKINPKQKTNEHLWSHPSPTKKQTEIIPVRCTYDRTIAKFLLFLEIDLDSVCAFCVIPCVTIVTGHPAWFVFATYECHSTIGADFFFNRWWCTTLLAICDAFCHLFQFSFAFS